MPTFGSLFAGIGGIDLGLERAGWECRWQVEWDAYCQRVLAKHWPDVPRYGDITAVDWSSVEPVDLIAGGFPCQPVSIAGRRGAQDDERWLWPEFLRAVRVLRPRLVLVENVRNLLAVDDGRAFGEVVGDLAASGYDATWDCVPAAAVGAPHRRDRVWIIGRSQLGRDVAHADDWRPFDAVRPGWDASWNGGADVADAQGEPVRAGLRPSDPTGVWRRRSGDGGGPDNVADSQSSGLEGWRIGGDVRSALTGPRQGRRAVGQHWSTEPDVGRVAHGVPARVDRLRALGNAVVPQVVEVIGRQLLQAFEEVAA